MQIRHRLRGQRIGLTLSGGNVDHDMFAQILSRPDQNAQLADRNVDLNQQRRAA